ncbi:MAG: alcohol dehydrogenase catalytic domain-containing protein [bacterium]|nr:alcohol dehydrogenase catalytic domain-containing protein [bacterium]
MTEMRSLLFHGPEQPPGRRFTVERAPIPEPGPGEVRIRVARVGLCGSDLHGYTGESGRRVAGMVMGHEASGWIDALGKGVSGPAPGTHVTFNPALPCAGACGHAVESRCELLEVVGVTPHIPGAFADYLTIGSGRVVPIPDLTPEQGAVIEPMAVGLHAANQLGATPEDRVLVVGGGMIGQVTAHAIRSLGAGEIVISEPHPRRREIAEAAGFATLHPDQVQAEAPFDRAMDAVAISATVSAALDAVPKGGVVCVVGLGMPQVTVPLFSIVVGERIVVGSYCYSDATFIETAHRLTDGSLDPAALIGPTVSMEDFPQAFEDLASGAISEVKVLMTTDRASG